jgi:DNA ligase (NAD+)
MGWARLWPNQVVEPFQDPARFAALQVLLEQLEVIPAPQIDSSSSPVAGKTVVFTGTVDTDDPSRGKGPCGNAWCESSGSVSAKTDILVAAPALDQRRKRRQNWELRPSMKRAGSH